MPNFIAARSTAQQAFASAEARHNFLVGTVPILFQERNFSTPCTFGRFLTKKGIFVITTCITTIGEKTLLKIRNL